MGGSMIFAGSAAQRERASDLLAGSSQQSDSLTIPNTKRRIRLFGSLFCTQGLKADELYRIERTFAILIGVILLFAWLLKMPLLVCGIPAAYVFLKAKATTLTNKRIEDFDKDYPAFLFALASSVKTGQDPLVALSKSGELFRDDSQIRHILNIFASHIEEGKTEEEALHLLSSALPYRDLRLFCTAFLLARKEGSSLADCLKRLGRVSRQRQSFRRKVRGALAMQKLSAFGIGGCTILIGVIQATANPDAVKTALADPVGSKLLFFSLFLVAAGVFWMIRMTKKSFF